MARTKRAEAAKQPRRFFYTEWGHITLSEVARRMGVPNSTLRHRLKIGTVTLTPAPQAERITYNPAYCVWADMKTRCNYPSNTSWKYYGARGIKVCPEWSTFAQFWADMGPTYKPGLTIERKDNSKGYSPDNCIWIPREQQHLNKSNVYLLDTPLGQVTLTEFARRSGLKEGTLRWRIKRGMSLEQAVAHPLNARYLREK